MCHVLMQQSRHAYVKVEGEYWGMKKVDVRDGQLWPVADVARKHGPYDYTVGELVIHVTHWKAPTLQQFLTCMFAVTERGVEDIDISHLVEAGIHIHHLVRSASRGKVALHWEVGPPIDEASGLVVPVFFGRWDILFADGQGVSVGEFSIPKPEYWQEISDEMKKILWPILTVSSKRQYDKWVDKMSKNLELLYGKLVP